MGPGTIAVFEGHRLPVLTAAISPDQLLALSGSCQQLDDQDNCLYGELILWDLVNKQEVRRWNGHTDWIHSAAFTPDGKYAISGSADGSLIQWDLSTAAPVQEYVEHTDSITSLSVSPDGNYLLSGSMDGTMIVWNLESGSLFQVFDGKSGGITSAAFAPDQKSAPGCDRRGPINPVGYQQRETHSILFRPHGPHQCGCIQPRWQSNSLQFRRSFSPVVGCRNRRNHPAAND
jgi:WD40 repeat protein